VELPYNLLGPIAYNNEHMASIGNKPEDWLHHRDTDNYGVLV
jgi:hypothetical protein